MLFGSLLTYFQSEKYVSYRYMRSTLCILSDDVDVVRPRLIHLNIITACSGWYQRLPCPTQYVIDKGEAGVWFAKRVGMGVLAVVSVYCKLITEEGRTSISFSFMLLIIAG
jgi:hypothetical protein